MQTDTWKESKKYNLDMWKNFKTIEQYLKRKKKRASTNSPALQKTT